MSLKNVKKGCLPMSLCRLISSFVTIKDINELFVSILCYGIGFVTA